MIKRILAIAITMLMLMGFAGCGQENTADTGDQQSEDQTTQSVQSTDVTEAFEFDDSVDYIDLTKMNSTMVYAQVLNIVQYPEQYVGKTLKMEGTFAVYYDEKEKANYYACLISDATACCSQGLEFTLGDNAKYPEDYPEVDSKIVVEGEITTYPYEDYVIPTLHDAKLK